jgi:nitroreductase
VDAYEAIVTKRDTREYEQRPIEPDALRRIVQAARMAGSSKNAQPIRLVLVTDPEIKQRLAGCGDFTQHLPQSPMVAVVVRLGDSRPFDAGRVAQNMMVAARAEGVASCPVGIQHDECARQLLSLPPEAIVAMAITLGYPVPGTAGGRGDQRIQLDQFVYQQTWDGHRGL